jgi:bifunctional non-homologous end joining protein LigD
MTDAPTIPRDRSDAVLAFGDRRVSLTNLDKLFFPAAGFTKRDLLQYYADVAPLLVPHVAGRGMVLKRYPNGQAGDFFYMKRTPPGAPPWLQRCRSRTARAAL